ncbi:hypothetical protein PFLUOLIPICF7_07380 [Pseudomonas simiae]|uniref:restriction endonuclease subunit S n=1 Tax=Pseudomonas simiae TaxID=321846 RepID=UPI0005D9B0BC|nr:restriction endonuclease subunit S [Pseudomonas simiae]AJZ97017.1 hypothetical protein PFLUOLIPICF7_07380 [Pseudomonas simiae]
MSEAIRTFPKSVQPGIPKLSQLKPGWKQYKFGQLFDIAQRPAGMQDDTEYDLVTVKRSRGGLEHRARLRGSQISVKSQFYLRTGDFLISKRQIVHGACGIVTSDFDGSIVSNEYSVLRCKDELSLAYLNYLSHSIYLQQTFFHSSVGVHIEKMIFKLEDWFKWKVNLPPKAEQDNVAAFLDKVSTRLRGLQEERELLISYKKALMQKLFSQELRFKNDDGSSFPEWNEKKLGEVFNWIKTNSLSREHLTFEEGKIQNIHYGDIHTKFNANFRQSEELVPFIADAAPIKEFSSDEFCRVGDVVIADASEDYADIGKAIEIVEVTENSLVAGLHTYIARPKDNQLIVGFSGYLFRSAPIRKQIMRIAQGISVLGVSKGNLSNLKFQIPHPDEQRKIAGALSAIDAKIDPVTRQIEQMNNFKKGLLQQLFA